MNKDKEFYTVEEANRFLEDYDKQLSTKLLRFFWWTPKHFIKDCFYNIKYWFQLNIRGYSDNEVYNLNYHITRYILPRLKALRNNFHGYPGDLSSEIEWALILDDMIIAFELILLENDNFMEYYKDHQSNNDKINKGLELFAKYFLSLWD